MPPLPGPTLQTVPVSQFNKHLPKKNPKHNSVLGNMICAKDMTIIPPSCNFLSIGQSCPQACQLYLRYSLSLTFLPSLLFFRSPQYRKAAVHWPLREMTPIKG